MKRDVIKLSNEGIEAISNKKDLNGEELKQLFDIVKAKSNSYDGIYDAITTAFYFGYKVGTTK